MDMEIHRNTRHVIQKSQLGKSPDVMKVGLCSPALQPPCSRDNLRSCDIECGAETTPVHVIMDTF